MKKLLLLIVTAGMVAPAAEAQTGFLDSVTCANISGWAYNSLIPNTPIQVDIYDGGNLVQAGVMANVFRGDLLEDGYGNGVHGFWLAPPAALMDKALHEIYIKYSGTSTNLGNTPLPMQCDLKSLGYTYYLQSTFGDAGNWYSYGSVSVTNNMFTSSDSSGNPGRWISNFPVSDGSSNYEVKTILSLKQTGGTYITYLHATGDPMSVGGSAIEIALSDPQFSGSGCSASLTVSDLSTSLINSQVTTQMSTDTEVPVPCADGMEIRAVVLPPSGGISWLGIMVGGTEYWTTSSITSGKPGIGAINTPSGNGLTLVSLGLRDNEAPANVDSGSVSTYMSVSPTGAGEVDLAWTGVVDNPNDGDGVGIWYYLIRRDGVLIGTSITADFTDSAVNAGDQHTYTIIAEDWHGNFSSIPASVTVTLPAAGSVDPRRVGVRPTGHYWGAMGEQIDTLSGNLNFSIALLKVMGRGGWSVPFGLSYNSQNWRQEGTVSWKMGADVGYGFGWQLMAGSLKPYYTGTWTLHHFIFTDSTGGEYRLDQQTGTVWSSQESIYVWYDTATNLLHFKDGSYWSMGCASGGVEPDAGTMYPTLMEDTNGNQITVSYLAGAGPFSPTGQGWNLPNTSARINQIFDARSHVIAVPGGYANMSYTFIYECPSGNNTPCADQINHLTSISNNFGTSENFSFIVDPAQPLNTPFQNTTACGSTGANCGSVGLLQSVTRNGVSLTTAFSYDNAGYGDLTQVQFPYGGHIRWSYTNSTYAGGRIMREVANRYLLKDVTATETIYSFSHDSGDTSRVVHSQTTIQDPTGAAKVAFNNWSTSPAWEVGLMSAFESRMSSSVPGPHRDDYVWAQAGGNAYVSQDTTTLDQGTSNQRVSIATSSVDTEGYGNVLSSAVYDYAASSPPLSRSTTTTYLNDSNQSYKNAYILNRVLTQTITPSGGSGVTVATNSYDQYNQVPYNYGLTTDAPGMVQHDPNAGPSFTIRGNVTITSTPSGITTMVYDTEGNTVTTIDPLNNSTNTLVDTYGNVPSTVMPNSNSYLSTSFSFNDFLGLTSVQNTNGATATVSYDSYGRPLTSTSPNGAVTYYYYCPDSCSNSGLSLPSTRNGQNYTRITVVNGRWSRDTYDGLGRVIRTERGDGTSNVLSVVDTDYESCGCSPTGKMYRTSQPYAPGGAVYWTTYSYDGLGRTISVQAADGASTTTYAYYGNTTVTTDPKGNWKAMTTDVNGNLTSVIEPDPSAGNVVAPSGVQSPSCGTAPLSGSTQIGGLPANTLGTCYYYDAFNNLTGVDLYRNSYNQNRTFTYQTGTNWLMSATNPENGTVIYIRDAMGHVLTRVDAAGQTTTYHYDSYYRLTQVMRQPQQYSGQPADPCQTENYYYDGQGVEQSFLNNVSINVPNSASSAYGLLTAVSFGNGTSGAYSVCPATAADASTWGGITYEYVYSAAGQVIGKRMAIPRSGYYAGSSIADLDAYWKYDNEGRPVNMTYPVVNDPTTGSPTSTAFTYGYDGMGRPSTMSSTVAGDPVSNVTGVVYNANNQITQMNYTDGATANVFESHVYNSMFQLTALCANWWSSSAGYGQSFSEQYSFSATQNNGQITSVIEGTGETVNYQYDQLKRLTSAGSTAGWSQSYTYDGFGNMTGKTPFSVLVNPANNQMVASGFTYDANGNLHDSSWGTSNYDVENRLVSISAGGGEQYMYDPSNKRIYKQNSSGETYFFYGLDGKVIGEYAVGWTNNGYTMQIDRTTESAYFGGKKVLPTVVRDRVGSVRGNASPANHPYGENYTNQTNPNTDGFATYYQDSSTGLNYADQRYYSASYGRFNTPDRYIAKTGGAFDPSDPQGWNRYTYVGNDPANWLDPTGRFKCADCSDDGGDDDQSGNYCSDNPTATGCIPGTAPGPGQNTGPKLPKCPQVPQLPSQNAARVTANDIKAANKFMASALATDPETALSAVFGYLAGNFAPNGPWDYKANYTPGTQAQANARVFGNLNFGAVLQSLGFSYTFTQNAAGIAQIGICISGGACGTGFPGLQYPFGDQVEDAVDVKKGFDYESAVQSGCTQPQ